MCSRCVWCVGWTWFSVLMAQVAGAAELSRRAETVDLFAALESRQIEVTVIPEDATRLTIQVANRQDMPLTIRMPAAVAAIPVLAQQLPGRGAGAPFGQGPLFGPGQGNNRNGGNPATQGLGAPLGQMGQNNNFPGGLLPGGLMNVLPGKMVKQKLPCVCLDFGKPNPRPQIPYRLVPLDSVQEQPAMRELLQELGRNGASQRIVQLAVWHVANSVSWEQLAQVPHVQANGAKRPRYSPAELAQAQRLLKRLPAAQEASASNSRLTSASHALASP